MDDDPGAFDDRRLHLIENRTWTGDLQRQVGGRVAEGEERRLRARSSSQLGDLPFYPDRTEPADPATDRL